MVRHICLFCDESHSSWFPPIFHQKVTPEQTAVGCQMLFVAYQQCSTLPLTVEKMLFSRCRCTSVQDLAGNPINSNTQIHFSLVLWRLKCYLPSLPFPFLYHLFSYYTKTLLVLTYKTLRNMAMQHIVDIKNYVQLRALTMLCAEQWAKYTKYHRRFLSTHASHNSHFRTCPPFGP